MGNRLTKIYTRTGDDGTTGLGNGERVSKDSLRVTAYGTVDELNSLVGLLIACDPDADLAGALELVQHRLFDLGGELSLPGSSVLGAEHTHELERLLDQLNESLPPLKEFVLPGGTQAAAIAHLARTVCRRAERKLITLAGSEAVNEESVHYLNRLSDLLFVIARTLNVRSARPEVLWRNPGSGAGRP